MKCWQKKKKKLKTKTSKTRKTVQLSITGYGILFIERIEQKLVL